MMADQSERQKVAQDRKEIIESLGGQVYFPDIGTLTKDDLTQPVILSKDDLTQPVGTPVTSPETTTETEVGQ